MSTNLTMSYSPNDFFYVKADDTGTMPTVAECSSLNPLDKSWDASCNSTTYLENNDKCLKKELCKNRMYATQLLSSQNQHGGADQKYMDTKQSYNNELLNLGNLVLGTVLLSGLLYNYLRK